MWSCSTQYHFQLWPHHTYLPFFNDTDYSPDLPSAYIKYQKPLFKSIFQWRDPENAVIMQLLELKGKRALNKLTAHMFRCFILNYCWLGNCSILAYNNSSSVFSCFALKVYIFFQQISKISIKDFQWTRDTSRWGLSCDSSIYLPKWRRNREFVPATCNQARNYHDKTYLSF